ncbi:hypothetical protein GQ42DRAFT_151457 [Ramicandelaber brevisporus]|nr:hypothetical protein GQ42DRAFT_151457 [Ramicandelaber brevisporus]
MSQLVTVVLEGGLETASIAVTPSTTLKSVVDVACSKKKRTATSQPLDPALYGLSLRGKPLDLSLTVRFAKIPSGSRLELVRLSSSQIQKKATAGLVTVALTPENDGGSGERLVAKLISTSTLWDILRHFEHESAGGAEPLNLTDRWHDGSAPPPAQGQQSSASSMAVSSFSAKLRGTFKRIGSMKSNGEEYYLMPSCRVMNKRFDSLELLKKTSLQSLGLNSGNHAIRVAFLPTRLTLAMLNSEHDRIDGVPIQQQQQPQQPEPQQQQQQQQPQQSTTTTTATAATASQQQQQSQPPSPAVSASTKGQSQPTVSAPASVSASNASIMSAATTTSNTSIQPPPVSSAPSLTKIVDESILDNPASSMVVLAPVSAESAAAAKPVIEEVPDSFFELTPAEAKQLMAANARAAAAATDAPLKTQAMRDAELREKQNKHPTTVIRVRFPDRLQLQFTLRSTDTIQALYDVVRVALRSDVGKFKLHVAPPARDLLNMTQSMHDAHLVPASIVHFTSLDGSDRGPGPFLSQEYMAKAQNISEYEAQVEASSSSATTTTTTAATAAAAPKEKKIPKWLRLNK